MDMGCKFNRAVGRLPQGQGHMVGPSVALVPIPRSGLRERQGDGPRTQAMEISNLLEWAPLFWGSVIL